MARTQGSQSGITGPRVRKAALALFATHGYAAVSMRQIASAVGVQVGALYNYTPDKQSLLSDLMQDHMQELLESWFALIPLTNPQDQLEQFTRFHIQFHSERPEEVFIAYMELRNLTEENFSRIEALRSAYETQLEDILHKGQAAGVFHVADTKIAAMAVIAMLTGVNTWYRSGGRLRLSEVEEIYWDMVRNTVSV